MDIYLVDVGLPLFDISYLNLGYGKYITENIYVAALFGIGTSNNTRKIYPNGGFEVGFNINNINISTSYTMMNTQSSLISLKIGFTSYK